MGTAEADLARATELQETWAFDEAAALYRRVAERALTVNVAANLALCLMETGEFEEAQRWLMLAACHRPGIAELRRLLGNLFTETGRVDEAELEYRTALFIEPGNRPAQLALGGHLLSVGRYVEGWPLMEARVDLSPEVVPPVKVSFPEWKGQPLQGKSVLVWYEQGLGDQIQFARFAQGLKARGASHVALGCRPALVELLRTATGVDEIVPVPRGGRIQINSYDFWSRYLSLPAPLGATLETLPTRPYLFAPADRRGKWPGYEGKVGFVWRSSPTGFNARNKNVPDDLARRILDLGALSLHPEDTGVADFADTAAIVEQLDLVISIDTSVAHLAGQALLDAAATTALRLALATGAVRQPLVSDHATLPPGAGERLGARDRSRGTRPEGPAQDGAVIGEAARRERRRRSRPRRLAR